MKTKINNLEIMNSLGVLVTRPNQEVIFMRGVPGIGKSTEAKRIVGDGKIHSTDETLVTMYGSYDDVFEEIRLTGNPSKLGKAHYRTMIELFESVEQGITPVILDNLNLHPSDMKDVVKGVLNLGISDKNIKFNELPLNKVTAIELSERTLHGVGPEAIQKLMDRYRTFKSMTLKKVLDSKDRFENKPFTFTCVLLDAGSRNSLLDRLSDEIPDGWLLDATHVTMVFGETLKDTSLLGTEVDLKVFAVGVGEKNIAVKVSGVETTNEFPHITIAIGPDGVPRDSNDIEKWRDIKSFIIKGTITEMNGSTIHKLNDLKK